MTNLNSLSETIQPAEIQVVMEICIVMQESNYQMVIRGILAHHWTHSRAMASQDIKTQVVETSDYKTPRCNSRHLIRPRRRRMQRNSSIDIYRDRTLQSLTIFCDKQREELTSHSSMIRVGTLQSTTQRTKMSKKPSKSLSDFSSRKMKTNQTPLSMEAVEKLMVCISMRLHLGIGRRRRKQSLGSG